MEEIGSEASSKLSNGISSARVISMFWIFSVNYFPFIFRAFYGVEYEVARGNTENFVDAMNSNSWSVDRALFLFSRAEWPGVTIFAFLTGFSLWYSILNSKVFRIGDYMVKRFNGVYVPYFVSVLVAVLVGVVFREIPLLTFDIAALLMGAAVFVRDAALFNPPTWFISLVFLCYLFFPIIPIIYSKLRFLGILSLALVSYSAFAYYGPSYFFYHYGPLYPLLPFWLFLCLGVLACHLIYKYQHLKMKIRAINFGLMHMICLLLIGAGMYFLYNYLYVGPESDLETVWATKDAFPAAMAGAFLFFSVGYLLPSKLNKPLRWLSRGTLGVFLYHYIALPFLAPYLGPPFFAPHLSIALVVTYALMLIGASLFQGLLDRTVMKWTRGLSYRDYEIY